MRSPETNGDSQNPKRAWVKRLQRLLFAVGVLLLSVYFVALADSVVSSRLALWRFQALQGAQAKPKPTSAVSGRADGGSNLGPWSVQRIAAYQSSLALKIPQPLATLRIPRLGFTAPVFEGTDDLTLNRGLGRIGGTAAIEELGNVGIAGHRDGFFRVLKDVVRGEIIELNTVAGRQDYVVDRITVVDPTNVEVLRPSRSARLTLITCYPFYFVGNAPYRYVVEASLVDANYKLD